MSRVPFTVFQFQMKLSFVFYCNTRTTLPIATTPLYLQVKSIPELVVVRGLRRGKGGKEKEREGRGETERSKEREK